MINNEQILIYFNSKYSFSLKKPKKIVADQSLLWDGGNGKKRADNADFLLPNRNILFQDCKSQIIY